MSEKLKRFVNNNKQLLIMLGAIAVMACGATYVLVIGGIDISNPAVMAASAVVGVYFMTTLGCNGVYFMTTLGCNLIVGTFVILLTSALLGLINGFAIAKLKMVPMVVTLSMMTIGTGLATFLSGVRGLPRLPDSFSEFFNKTSVIIILVIVTVVLDFILTGTKFGRKLYYIGNNARTAKVSGIDSENIIMFTYVISGLCAGIAGVINTASIGTARANMGPQSQILDIISAAVIGGVSTSGGSGRVRDAVLASFLVVGLTNVMNLLNVSDYYTTLIKGGIIIGAMGIASFRQQRAAKRGV